MLRRIFAATLASLMLVSGLGAGMIQPARAATTTVFLRTVDIISGQPITSACYTIINASEEGCDENGDGLIRYQGVASGTFTVTQTERASGYLPVGDFPLTIGSSGPEEYFTINLARSDGVNQQTADIAVSAVDSADRKPSWANRGSGARGDRQQRDDRRGHQPRHRLPEPPALHGSLLRG